MYMKSTPYVVRILLQYTIKINTILQLIACCIHGSQAVSRVLWKMLSGHPQPAHPRNGCEEEAAILLCQLYSVSQFSNTVEEILLEEFAAKVLLLTLLFVVTHYTSLLTVSVMLSAFFCIMAVWDIVSTSL